MEELIFQNNIAKFDKQIQNDYDNAHDRTVNELSKSYYNYLKKHTILDYDFDNILTFVNDDVDGDIFCNLNKNLVLNYLNHLLLNNENIANFVCNECDFLTLCWNRSKMNINITNKHDIQMNILNNIVDFYSTDYDVVNHLVIKKLCCPSGRVMKLLSSFCYLDYNITLGAFLSTDMLRREFLNKASTIYFNDILLIDYNTKLDDIICEYNDIYQTQLYTFKDVLIKSLVF
jgi:hypothetical protein